MSEMESSTINPQADRFAGFWIRLGATLIDVVLIILVTYPILIFVYGWDYLDPEKVGYVAGFIDLLVTWVLPIPATILFWLNKKGTPGKLFCSLKIIDEKTRGDISIKQALIRYFSYFISTTPLGFGFIWVVFNPKKQSFHDLLAGTIVVRSK